VQCGRAISTERFMPSRTLNIRCSVMVRSAPSSRSCGVTAMPVAVVYRPASVSMSSTRLMNGRWHELTE